MKFGRQSEIIKSLTDQQLRQQVYISQLFLFLLGLVFSFFLFDSFSGWRQLIVWDPREIFLYGFLSGIGIVGIDLVFAAVLPRHYWDDGGLNEKIFRTSKGWEIFAVSLAVAWTEEFLFRGIVHHFFGYIAGSLSFALLHFRYLTKPVLLLSVIAVSFYLGLLFEITGNLLVPVMAHFTIDCALGWAIRKKSRKGGKRVGKEA